MDKTINFENGDKYVGEVNDKGEPHGFGTLEFEYLTLSCTTDGYAHTHKNSAKHVGYFANGKRHGKGTTFYDGFQDDEGEWVNGERIADKEE